MTQEQDYVHGVCNSDAAEIACTGSMERLLDHGHGNHEEIGKEDDANDDDHGAAHEEEEHDTDLCLGLGLPGGSSSRNGSNSSTGLTSFGNANGVKRGYNEANVVLLRGGGRFHTEVDYRPSRCIQQQLVTSDRDQGFTVERFEVKFHGSNDDPLPPSKDRAIGWPPIRSYRKNALAQSPDLFVKVNMDGVAIGRKVDLGAHASYEGLRFTLEDMFLPASPGGASQTAAKHLRLPSRSDYVLTYEDKEGDWMLVGDVPWRYIFFAVRFSPGSPGFERFQEPWIHFKPMPDNEAPGLFSGICLATSDNSIVSLLSPLPSICSMFVSSVRRLRIQRRAESMGLSSTCLH